jgi:ribosome-associated heat shock protein Hsp15
MLAFDMGPKHGAFSLARRPELGKFQLMSVPDQAPKAPDGRVRIDQFLHAARAYKSRSDARQACEGGRVALNGLPVKASHAVRVGDEIRADAPRGAIVWKVLVLADKRVSTALARTFYEDHSPPPPAREERFPARERGAGRPTKRERRDLRRFRGDF